MSGNAVPMSKVPMAKFQWAIEKFRLGLSFWGPGFNSTSLERSNSNERKNIRKKKENAKEFWNLALVILEQAFIKQRFTIIIPNVTICSRHRLVLTGIFCVSFYEQFHFLARKNHVNPPNKLIVKKLIRCTLPMFNNKAFLDLIDKLSWRIYNKNKKQIKQRVANSQKHLWLYLLQVYQQQVITEIVQFLIKFYLISEFTQNLYRSINHQNNKHKVQV